MHRPPYEYTSPLNNYYTPNRNHEYDPNFAHIPHDVFPTDPRFSPSNYNATNPHIVQRPDLYEGNNDNTLRAEERNWYIENHRNNHNHYGRPHETLPRTSKDQRKEEDKKHEGENGTDVTRRTTTTSRLRRKEDRCSCECWPTGSPEATVNNDSTQQKPVHQSAVDMVASYGVYQNPQEDDDQAGFVRLTNRGYPYQDQQQGVVVNETGDSSVIPRGTEVVDNATTQRSFMQKCCTVLNGSTSTPAPNGQDVDCWVTCCKPAIFLFLLVLMVVVFTLVAGLLFYYNYYSDSVPIPRSGSHRYNKDMTYKPRQSIPEEPCEKTFCRWGAMCVSLGDGRTHCQCPARCPTTQDPVCSTEGKTYANPCLLRKESCEKRANARVSHSGECELSDPCRDIECQWGAQCTIEANHPVCRCPKCPPRSVQPVCGSDAKEYLSACELTKIACEDHLNITLIYHGKCDPCAEHKCEEQQVCQLDGGRNPMCRCGETCPLTLDPVCASDGNTYGNECELREESCRSRREMRIIYRGKCSSGVNPCSSVSCRGGEHCWIGVGGVAQCGCGGECEPYLRPVCGTDGQTYNSLCHLRKTACTDGKQLQLAHHGTCGTMNPCTNHTCGPYGECVSVEGIARCSCPRCGTHLQPVCATDGRTYTNECKMREKSCEMTSLDPDRQPLMTLYNGSCETCEEKKCEFYAVCEMDSIAKTKCVCPGNCSSVDNDDTGTENPIVCGTDGFTYGSECHLKNTACEQQQNIAVAYEGDCSLCQSVECKFGARCSAGECICPMDCSGAGSEPVCSNSMITYSNECELQKAACDLPKGHKQLHVIFYGDCEDRFAVAGPPIALTTPLPLPFPPVGNTLSEIDTENSTTLMGITDYPEHSLSTLEQLACRDIHCDFDATCELGSDNMPRCSCIFDCPLDETSEDYFPVCASDMKLYTSMCAMRMEGCHKHIELRLRPLELCKGMEMRHCGGGTLMLDSMGQELDCGGGPSRRDCPAGSYCHQTMNSARCCIKNDTIPRKSCDESVFGRNSGNCVPGCGCHRLGSLLDACDITSRQCPCRPGVGGLKCDRCEPGFWGLPRIGNGHKGCIPCGCSMFGSVREDCEQMTGRCVCKNGIQGQKCTLCTNHLEILGPNGCYNAETGALAPKTCKELLCYFGSVCFESEGRAYCQCTAASCPTDSTDPSLVVCGSDGKTYPSECHLKLQACRTQEDVVVQAFGVCKGIQDPSGTALPSKHYSPLHFTQQDDTNFPSKSTRHLLVPDPRNYNYNYGRGYEIFKDKDSTSSLDGEKGQHRAIYRPTPATVRAPPALVGDLCSIHADCLVVPNSRCDGGACICRPGYTPALDRRKCMSNGIDIKMTNEELQACSSEPCMNSGTCIDLPEVTFTCICEPQFTGDLCQHSIPLPDLVRYIETPSFDGRSYIRLKPLKAYHKLNIDVQFKTFSENGILLYDQQNADGSGDFVSLALVNGYIEFRYNLGDGIVILTSLEKVSFNEYHTISAKRYHRDGILSVDDMEDVVGQSIGSLKALDLLEDTFIGSVPSNISKIFDNIGTKHGFTGCIKHLRIIRHQVTKKLGREDTAVLGMDNIKECTANPCVSMPCLNGATCTTSNDEEFDYTCICPGNFKGPQCEEKVDPCESNPCGLEEDIICETKPSGSYICKCLFGGKLISKEENSCAYDYAASQEIRIPEFNGSSYLQLPKLDGLSNSFKIEIWFMTKKLSGVLFYNSQSARNKGDFIAINLIDGFLQFRFNLGSGIANITYPEKISKDRWHKVKAYRIGREGSLKVDNLPTVHGHSAPPLTELNLGLPLYLGSLPFYMKPHKLSGITSSFVGAIQQVFINSMPLNLYGEDTVTCSMLPSEEIIPCATLGVSKYSGFPCNHVGSPCQNGALCIPMMSEYKCVCKKGHYGKNCENKVYMDIINNNLPVKFDGNTFYAYRSRGSRRKYPNRGIRFEIKFKSTESSGLLLWRKKGGVGQGDFLALGIIDGHAELIYSDYTSLDKKSNQKERWYNSIKSKIRVDDGLWHTVAIKRRKRMALIQVDNQHPSRGYSHLPLSASKVNPKLWIGGAPSLPQGLLPQLYHGLKGCISSVKAHGRYLNLHKPISQQHDVLEC